MSAPPRPRSRRLRWRRSILIGAALLVVLVVVWVGLAIFGGGHQPGPQRDFLSELNEQNAAVPMNQRVWPVLRRAVAELKLDQDRSFSAQMNEYLRKDDSSELEGWLQGNQEAIASIRAALRLPSLGYLYEFSLPEPADRFLLLTSGERATLVKKGSTVIR